MNNIPATQNTDRFLNYLAASSSVYATVKWLFGIQVVLTVLVPVAMAVIAIAFPHMQGWAALYGITVSLLDLIFIDAIQEDQKRDAAKIQEAFDCELMQMPWNGFKVGDHPAPERIRKAAKKYRGPAKRDWYSVHVATLHLDLARIALQRSNIYWDSGLRRHYSGWILTLLIVLAIVAVGIGFALEMPLNSFVLAVATLLPTFQWLIRDFRKQRQSIGHLDRLNQYANETWAAAISGSLTPEELTMRSRELQDELFAHRSSNQPVPNWFFFLVRSGDEDAMNAGVEEMVREYLTRKSK